MNEFINKPQSEGEGTHLLDFFIVLAKHSRLIVYTTVAVTMLKAISLLLSPNEYTATARLLAPQQNLTLSAQVLDHIGARMPSGPPSAGGMAANLLGLKSPGILYVGMLTGNTISDRIIERFNLRELSGAKYIEDLRSKLRSQAKITSGKDGIINIEVTDKSPQRAADLANAYIEELDKLLQGMARAESKERLAFLEKELHQASLNLSKAEESLRNFSEQSSVLQIDAQTKGMLEYIASLRASIDSKEVQLLVLRQQATPFNYDLIRLETELKGLKEKLQAANTQESRNPVCGDTMIPTTKVPALGLEYLRLYRNVKFQEGLYQLYCQLTELARMEQVRTTAVVHVIDRAQPPEKKSNARRWPTLKAGFITFFLMILVALLKEYWQNFKNREGEAKRLAIITTYLKPWSDKMMYLSSILKKKLKRSP